VDDKTIKRWCLTLENTYVLFKITPYSKSIKNTLKKSPKYYFFDFPRVLDEGARLENLVALSIYKECLFRNDTMGEDYTVHYLRNRQKQEVDFVICKNKKPIHLIEVKLLDDTPSNDLKAFAKELSKSSPDLKTFQLVKNLKRNFSTPEGLQVVNLGQWLEKMPF
jgi:uncharacterized protein